MNIRRWLAPISILFLGLGWSSWAEDKPTAPANGYKVVLELKITEAGTVDDAKVFSSDDTSADHVLDRTAMEAARGLKLPPRMKEGKAVKYTARAPFMFSVDNDEGPGSNNAPKPSIHSAVQPIYPADLAEKGEVGGAIMELMIGADGKVSSIKTLRSSNPEFEKAATEAVGKWVFNPAKKDDTAIDSRWRIAVAFETDVRRADWKWRFPPRPALGSYSVVHRTLPDEPTGPEKPAISPKAPENPAGK